MKAVQITAYGGSDRMLWTDVAVPTPGDGEVLVRIERAGVNFIDVYMREGIYRRSHTYANALPFTLGMEGAGRVAAVGSAVEGLAEGDRVAWCLSRGSYAEQAAVPAWRLVKVPDDVPTDIAATFMLQGCTAHYLTHSAFPLGPGKSCLIHAGAGGVGQLVIQLAKRLGAQVFATVGSPAKAEIATARGADHVILYRETDFREAILAITGGAGLDVVYDSVGQATFARSIRTLKRRGTCVLFGGASGAVTAVDPLDLAETGSVFLTRPHLADYMADAGEINRRADSLFAAWRDGGLTVTIDRHDPLAEAATAHDALESRETAGKILLEVAD
jgi:NADPH2:quinone reductase